MSARAYARVVVALLVGGVMARAATADIITVCWDGSGDYLTIQEGIDAALDGAEVVVCDGTYTGVGNRDLDFDGRLITVQSQNGPDNCIIDCQASVSDPHRGFYFHGGENQNAILDGFTIRDGYVTGDSPGGSNGGAVCCDNSSSPTVTNCRFSGSIARYGGGMSNRLNSSPTVTNCTFSGNKAGKGGGIYSDASSPTVTACAFSGNMSRKGGGMYNWSSSPTLTNCTFGGNWGLLAEGGGMYNHNSSPTLTNCAFSGNSGMLGWGGGMYNYNSSPAVMNCTFSGNSAPGLLQGFGEGGGVYSSSGSNVSMANCVLWGDSPDEIVEAAGAVVTVRYSDVQGGWSGEGNIDDDPLFVVGPSGTWTTDAVYDPQTDQTTFTDGGAGWVPDELVGKFLQPDTAQTLQLLIVANTDTTVTVWGDFAQWSSIGGSYQEYQIHDYRLSAGSLCIDAADNTVVPPDTADLDDDGDTAERTPLDLDYNPRFVDPPPPGGTGVPDPPDYPEIVDMGAYEFQEAPPCPGDIDGDGTVDQFDLGILLASFGSDDGGDLDGDGDTDPGDLGILLAHVGTTRP